MSPFDFIVMDAHFFVSLLSSFLSSLFGELPMSKPVTIICKSDLAISRTLSDFITIAGSPLSASLTSGLLKAPL